MRFKEPIEAMPTNVYNYLLERNISASKADKNGNLPLHVALCRALSLPPTEAKEVYFNVVVPLREAYPLAVDIDDEEGRSGHDMLTALKQHIQKGSSGPQKQPEMLQQSYEEEWRKKLAQEFESESTEFFGRYACEEGITQETEQESYDEWANRMGREYRQHKEKQKKYYSGGVSDGTRDKCQHHEKDNTKASHHSKRKAADEEALSEERRKMQKRYRHEEDKNKRLALKKNNYETNYHDVLQDKSGQKLGFHDIPWPCEGNIENVVEVLFCDLPEILDPGLRKYLREQQVRWHPDKFMQRFSDRLAPESTEQVLERVKAISQAVNSRVETVLSKTKQC
ncbi:hypothetical protein C0Q70_18191 [Pomacea canaliculata]|uniref:NF-kappa-B inhibitor-like protein 1 n=1 Tax=Pomacea canaliculata TaxID=400727 RepID=A0A2T7NMI9_POMCA|nr:hypothetical protein C0Q70_18191 [Pomacea canaliculata]